VAIDLANPGNLVTTRLRQAINWGRKYSLWPLPYGTACCAIEFMASVSSYHDLSRYGAELVRFSPRQSDLMIVAGTVSYKQAPILKTIYAQMCEPKWVIAMGVCASSGGFYKNYGTLQGIDRVIPTDIYVAGCPPTPENLFHGLLLLQQKIEREGPVGSRQRHPARAEHGDQQPDGNHER
jgi:NADH-quinone oxidoreductase subunit B